jgi:hypothetical protein
LHPHETAFLKTTRDWDVETYMRWERHGYSRVNFQAQNDLKTVDFDLNRCRAAGLAADVWGVTYAKENFYRDGRLLGSQAVKLGADDATMNCEMAAKDTRASRGLRPIIEGVRDGGWIGPVNLNTLGAPINPDVNDFAMDIESFLETGGGVACQAYANAHPESYMPEACMRYWLRMGVPFERLNLTIGLYDPASENPQGSFLTGADYVPLLQAAKVRHNISIFMPETMHANDLAELEAITKAELPPSADGGIDMEKIGSEHGITGFVSWLRKQPDVPPRGPRYDPENITTWPFPDRIERTLKMLAADHDERADG